MDFVAFGGFHKRAPREAAPAVDWSILPKLSRYNQTQADELDHIADSTEAEPEGSAIAKHDQEADLLNKDNGFTHAQAISGRAGEIVTARFSKRTKLILGAVATVTFGFGIGFVDGYLSTHEGTTDISKLCTEGIPQSALDDPNSVAVQLSNCDQNQILGR